MRHGEPDNPAGRPATARARTVVVVQELLTEYRVPFHTQLRDALAAHGVVYELVHGSGNPNAQSRNDAGRLAWAAVQHNRYFGPFVWQSMSRRLLRSDLVIVEQANRLLLNYLLLAARTFRGPKVAFWGHGWNHQANTRRVRDIFKRSLLRSPDHWFAYTAGVAEYLRQCGVSPARITDVQNSVETGCLLGAGCGKVSKNALFVGGLIEDKRIPLLLEAADIVHRFIPEFSLTMIGSGPYAGLVTAAVADRPWLKSLGADHGSLRDEKLSSAELILMPGLVGLVAVDSFAARAPIVTLAHSQHSPEYEYLVDGENAIVVEEDTAAAFATAVINVLQNPEQLAQLRRGCVASAMQYNLGEMVTRFCAGILVALEDRDA